MVVGSVDEGDEVRTSDREKLNKAKGRRKGNSKIMNSMGGLRHEW